MSIWNHFSTGNIQKIAISIPNPMYLMLQYLPFKKYQQLWSLKINHKHEW